MAVRLLAKFDLRIPETTAMVNMNVLMWHPAEGLIAAGNVQGEPGSDGVGIVTLDGVFRDRADESVFQLNQVGWWPAKKRMVEVWNMASIGQPIKPVEMVFDPYIFGRQNANPPGVLAEGLYFRRYVRFPDRAVYYSGGPGGDKFLHGVVGGIDTREGTELPFYYGDVHPGRSNTETFVGEVTRFVGDDTRGVFYDAVTHTLSDLLHTGVKSRGIYYATDFRVLVTWQSPEETPGLTQHQLWVWSLEVNPTIMTPVEVFEGEPRSGQIVTYRVQVTGDQEDPAPNELVNWEVTGVGTLLTPQSKTDVEGFAVAKVQYGVQEIGTSVVEASLLC